MEKEHLHLLITEEIYLLSQDEVEEKTEASKVLESEAMPEPSDIIKKVVEEPVKEKEQETERIAEVVDSNSDVVKEPELKVEAKQASAETKETFLKRL